MRPLTVIYVFNFPDAVGGGEESLLGLIGALPRAVIHPVLVVPGEGGIAERGRAVGLPVSVVPMPRFRPWPGVPHLRAVRSLAGVVSGAGADLVHANGSRAMLYAALAVRRRCPLLWHVRIVDADPWLDGTLSRAASAIVANSQATAARFGRRPGAMGKVRVIPNGVDLTRVRPGAPDQALRVALGLQPAGPVVGYIGRLEHGKGPDVLLAAAVMIHRKIAQASVLMIGEGPMRARLEAEARAAALPVVFTGYRPDLLPLLHLAAVLAVPSRQEAFGRVLIEAMAARVPVVAARVGGIPEVCVHGRTGLLVPPDDPDALAAAVVATLTEPDATRARVDAAAEDVRARFDLLRHAERVRELYETLVARGPARDR